MSFRSGRRTALKAALAASVAWCLPLSARVSRKEANVAVEVRLAVLEREYGGRLGVCAMEASSGRHWGYRAGERFPFCSTFKAMLAAAVLKWSESDPSRLEQMIPIAQSDLISHSPVTSARLDSGMQVAELCAATVQYSDNAAANLLLRLLGGPEALTGFARAIGDEFFRLDRWETELNTAIPGDERDTTTPEAMARSLHRLVLGDALSDRSRSQLTAWLRGNTTGDRRIRAGVPLGWSVGDKTGSGGYGTTNDVGVIWPADTAPIALAIYYTRAEPDADASDAIIAAATRVVVEALDA